MPNDTSLPGQGQQLTIQPDPPRSLKGKSVAGKLGILPEDLDRHLLELLCPSSCTDFLLTRLYPDGGIPCPWCGAVQESQQRNKRLRKLLFMSCESCGKTFKALGRATIFNGLHSHPHEMMCMMILIRIGLDASTISKIMECDDSTVHRWIIIFNEFRQERTARELAEK